MPYFADDWSLNCGLLFTQCNALYRTYVYIGKQACVKKTTTHHCPTNITYNRACIALILIVFELFTLHMTYKW